MYLARLTCSDVRCAAEVEAEATTLAELETLSCDCGCALAVIAWPDDVRLAEVVPLAVRVRIERRAA